MKKPKQRVIAIDYFRGLCILAVVVDHGAVFTKPLNYLFGASTYWTSAAEMFFLLSGLTLWIVRGEALNSNFRATTAKIWRRAASLYMVYVLAVLASLSLALFLTSKSLLVDIPGALPQLSSGALLVRILDFSYNIGWANFLAYYVAFLALAPFAMRLLRTRWWPALPTLSLGLYVLTSLGLVSNYNGFGIWQLYFYIGLTLARFRPAIIAQFYGLGQSLSRRLGNIIVASAGLMVALRFILAGRVHSAIARVVSEGWLPAKFQSAYNRLFSRKETINFLLQNNRVGLLRPLAAVLTLAAAYVLYQRYKTFLLKYTGRFVNTMGQNTLWVFVAQSLAIPLLAILPIERSVVNNLLMTSLLVALMWVVAKRRAIELVLMAQALKLRDSLAHGLYSYRTDEDEA